MADKGMKVTVEVDADTREADKRIEQLINKTQSHPIKVKFDADFNKLMSEIKVGVDSISKAFGKVDDVGVEPLLDSLKKVNSILDDIRANASGNLFNINLGDEGNADIDASWQKQFERYQKKYNKLFKDFGAENNQRTLLDKIAQETGQDFEEFNKLFNKTALTKISDPKKRVERLSNFFKYVNDAIPMFESQLAIQKADYETRYKHGTATLRAINDGTFAAEKKSILSTLTSKQIKKMETQERRKIRQERESMRQSIEQRENFLNSLYSMRNQGYAEDFSKVQADVGKSVKIDSFVDELNKAENETKELNNDIDRIIEAIGKVEAALRELGNFDGLKDVFSGIENTINSTLEKVNQLLSSLKEIDEQASSVGKKTDKTEKNISDDSKSKNLDDVDEDQDKDHIRQLKSNYGAEVETNKYLQQEKERQLKSNIQAEEEANKYAEREEKRRRQQHILAIEEQAKEDARLEKEREKALNEEVNTRHKLRKLDEKKEAEQLADAQSQINKEISEYGKKAQQYLRTKDDKLIDSSKTEAELQEVRNQIETVIQQFRELGNVEFANQLQSQLNKVDSELDELSGKLKSSAIKSGLKDLFGSSDSLNGGAYGKLLKWSHSQEEDIANQASSMLTGEWANIRNRVLNGEKIDSSEITNFVEKAKREFRELEDVVQNTYNQMANPAKVSNMMQKIAKWLNNNGKASKEAKADLNSFYDVLKGGNITVGGLNDIGDQFNRITAEEIKAGRTGQTFLQGLGNRMKSITQSAISMAFSFYDVIRYAKEIASTVTEVDSALTELRKVSDASDTRLDQSFQTSAETAKELGATITDVINSTADWSRLGWLYSLTPYIETYR